MTSTWDTRVTWGKLLVPAGDDTLVVIYSRTEGELGRRYPLVRDVVTIGRDPGQEIVLESDAVSRSHARIERRGDAVSVCDLGSTNGTFVNEDVTPVTTRQLHRGDHIRVGDTVFKYLAGSDIESQYHDAIFTLTVTDGLTGVGNVKHLQHVLGREIPRAQRHRRDLAVQMIDLDHFKAINDRHGHLGGDAVLRGVAREIDQRLRDEDVLCRYGGEEFCAVLPETSREGAAQLAEELRSQIEALRCPFEDHSIQVTASIGVAALTKGMDAQAILRAADTQLYRAKSEGRNRVCV